APGLRGDGQEPAHRHRPRARADRARRRLLRQPQALPERRLLLGRHLRGDGAAAGDVPRPVRDRAHGGLDGAVGGAGPRRGAEDHAPEAALRGMPRTPLRAARPAPRRGRGRDGSEGAAVAPTPARRLGRARGPATPASRLSAADRPLPSDSPDRDPGSDRRGAVARCLGAGRRRGAAPTSAYGRRTRACAGARTPAYGRSSPAPSLAISTRPCAATGTRSPVKLTSTIRFSVPAARW